MSEGVSAVGLRVTQVCVGGVCSPVVLSGSPVQGEAVVFVHGNPGEAVDWSALLGEINEFAPAVAPDMPGYGGADKPKDFDYTSDGYGRHLGGIIDQLGITRAHLVLHDLGGPWGLAWAATSPDALASLTLISIGALPGYRWHRFARLYRRPLLGEFILATAFDPAVARILRSGSKRELPSGFAAKAGRMYRDRGTRRAVLAFYRRTPDLGSVTVAAAETIGPHRPPTLVIWGAGDPYVPVRFATIQKQFFPDATVVTLPDSGHWPFVDDHASVAAALVPFLREQFARR